MKSCFVGEYMYHKPRNMNMNMFNMSIIFQQNKFKEELWIS